MGDLMADRAILRKVFYVDSSGAIFGSLTSVERAAETPSQIYVLLFSRWWEVRELILHLRLLSCLQLKVILVQSSILFSSDCTVILGEIPSIVEGI